MTAAVKAPTNGHRRPVVMTVARHQLVGEVMDASALVEEARISNGAALSIVDRFARDAVVYELMRCLHDTHNRLTQARTDLRDLAGDLDRVTD